MLEYKYFIQQPKTLEMFALEKLTDWLTHQATKISKLFPENYPRNPTKAKDLLDQEIELTRKYLERGLPGMYYNKLFSKVTGRFIELKMDLDRINLYTDGIIYETNTIEKMIIPLLTKNLTSMTIWFYAWDEFQNTIISNTSSLSRLTDLKLYVVNENDEDKIINLLSKLNNLEVLHLDICSDNVLQCVVDNCKLIKDLTICNWDVDDKNLILLSNMSNLTTIDLMATHISENGVANLLMSCDNIEHIILNKYDYLDPITMLPEDDIVALALEHITSMKVNARKQFKLKSYQNYGKMDRRQLETLIKTCPLIKKITLQTFDDCEPVNYLPLLNELNDLKEITLKNYSFYEDQVNEFLNIKKYKLVSLTLQSVENIDINALLLIYKMCPNLQSLTFYNCVYNHTPNIIRKMPNSPLNNLENLTITTKNRFEFQEPTEEQFIFLLSNCPNIQYLDLTKIEHPMDKIISKVLTQKPRSLMYLKHLKIRNNFSAIILDQLVANCKGSPEVKAWKRVRMCGFTNCKKMS